MTTFLLHTLILKTMLVTLSMQLKRSFQTSKKHNKSIIKAVFWSYMITWCDDQSKMCFSWNIHKKNALFVNESFIWVGSFQWIGWSTSQSWSYCMHFWVHYSFKAIFSASWQQSSFNQQRRGRRRAKVCCFAEKEGKSIRDIDFADFIEFVYWLILQFGPAQPG